MTLTPHVPRDPAHNVTTDGVAQRNKNANIDIIKGMIAIVDIEKYWEAKVDEKEKEKEEEGMEESCAGICFQVMVRRDVCGMSDVSYLRGPALRLPNPLHPIEDLNLDEKNFIAIYIGYIRTRDGTRATKYKESSKLEC